MKITVTIIGDNTAKDKLGRVFIIEKVTIKNYPARIDSAKKKIVPNVGCICQALINDNNKLTIL